MRILIFNWRDIKNPTSGGAEILTHEIAKGLVKKGNSVTQFSSVFKNALSEEIVDGVKIMRRGHADIRYLFSSVHFLAFFYYQKIFKNKFDLVIDEIHGIPFFTPWYVKEKKMALICEVAGELWSKMFGSILGSFGRLIELFYLNIVYKRILFLTISYSTREDMINNGVDKSNIKVMPMGISVPRLTKHYKKEKRPTFLFVGRLSKSKGVEDAIVALSKVIKVNPNTVLWIVGRGKDDYINYLKKISRKLGIKNKVFIFGFVDNEKKFELMARSHILISPSIKEGFGLTIPEAAFVGTPSIVYNSFALSEVVLDYKTGIICRENTPAELAKNMLTLIKDKMLYKKLSLNAILESKKYNWDKTVTYFAEVINAL